MLKFTNLKESLVSSNVSQAEFEQSSFTREKRRPPISNANDEISLVLNIVQLLCTAIHCVNLSSFEIKIDFRSIVDLMLIV